MDTSEQYIKMCEKAEEIQKECPFKEGDFILNKSAISPPGGFLFINYKYQPNDNSPEWEMIYEKEQRRLFNIWLPRQDQLQEMISLDLNVQIKLFFNEMKWGEQGNSISKNPMYVIDLKSMEQLWLAFVMKEKYGKVWDGETWVEA